ncbi:hypothetical protein KM043_018848, partial [Ampulex compressa]
MPTLENLISFKYYRAKAKRAIIKAKKQSWENYISEITKDTPLTQIWQKIRTIAGNPPPIIAKKKVNGNRPQLKSTFSQATAADIYSGPRHFPKHDFIEELIPEIARIVEKYIHEKNTSSVDRSQQRKPMKLQNPIPTSVLSQQTPRKHHIDTVQNIPSSSHSKTRKKLQVIVEHPSATDKYPKLTKQPVTSLISSASAKEDIRSIRDRSSTESLKDEPPRKKQPDRSTIFKQNTQPTDMQ